MADNKYSVSWEAYQKSICYGLSSLQQRGEFVDMTLAAEGHHVKVHQIVMSLVSPYIRDLIGSAACPHPVIFLNKLSYLTLQSILQYAYTGEVVVSNDRLQEFLAACKELHIRGLESMQSLETANYEPQKNRNNTTNIDKPSEKPPIQILNTKRLRAPTVESPQKEKDHIFKTVESCIDYSMGSDDVDDVFTQSPSDEEPKTTHTMANKIEAAIKYTLSNYGTTQIVVNRFIYCFKYEKQNGHQMWRCYDTKNCGARIVIKNQKVIRRTHAHNHPYHDIQILKRLRNRNMFSSINEVQQAIDKKKDKQAKTEHASTVKPAKQAEVFAETDDE